SRWIPPIEVSGEIRPAQLLVVLSEQIVPGSFAFALNYLVDHELDLSALDARFKSDEVGGAAPLTHA
ncbi:hypothetical protein, partial [Roseateles sp.]|uniref:hypothetical protein n=1 Tax=Roseateles sp. TaxID=1971397 RepID=UPI003BA7E294